MTTYIVKVYMGVFDNREFEVEAVNKTVAVKMVLDKFTWSSLVTRVKVKEQIDLRKRYERALMWAQLGWVIIGSVLVCGFLDKIFFK